ncbi:MAG: hypothetical protein A3J93_01335 [Candidatus Magasanikbacteria bacterium RIFOXYC2_FULL_42_28]|uniref:Uncharacterized protein n=1 Tax=Candidatus Magasanikbacteria bacterium RIFOXYC2_FULL_42_28 TaxID=1798704 RepID=A0A1F6NXV7_9BACT|nr:MAG: hypothetical protein A3J93_01335 [Candidatus Magasanikbacteria bacterium RIFOXYC2_FULL_42_28]
MAARRSRGRARGGRWVGVGKGGLVVVPATLLEEGVPALGDKGRGGLAERHAGRGEASAVAVLDLFHAQNVAIAETERDEPDDPANLLAAHHQAVLTAILGQTNNHGVSEAHAVTILPIAARGLLVNAPVAKDERLPGQKIHTHSRYLFVHAPRADFLSNLTHTGHTPVW